MEKIPVAFRAWKHECRMFYREIGIEHMPIEFAHRPDQWHWLVNHFQEPEQEKLCEHMSEVVRMSESRMNHHSGKVAFPYRAEEHYEKGAKAPWIDTFAEVYAGDPRGAEYAEKMKRKVDEMLDGLSENDPGSLEDVLPLEVQSNIIDEVLEKKNGTGIGGIGSSRPPRPRGHAKPNMEAYVDLQEQLSKITEALARKEEEQARKDEEQARKEAELERKIRMLEARIGLGSQGGDARATSDGASFEPMLP